MSNATYRHDSGKALEASEAIRSMLAGRYEIFNVGGSARRNLATVGDLELVIQPKLIRKPADTRGQATLFPVLVTVDDTAAALDGMVAWSLPDRDGPCEPPMANGVHWAVIKGPRWGPKHRQLLIQCAAYDLPGLQVDVFLPPDPEQYGWIWLLRTGSGAFNEWLIRRMKHPASGTAVEAREGFLWRGKRKLPTETEEQVFAAAGLPFIPPERRSVLGGESEDAAGARWQSGG